MPRNQFYACFILAILFVFAGFKAEASGTYYRSGSSSVAHGSSLKKGEVRAGVRADFQHYSRIRLASGNYQRVLDVRLRTYTLFGEFGLTNDSTVYASIPYVDNDSDIKAPAYASESGLGDARIGYNKTFGIRKSSNLVGTLEATIPVRNYSTKKLTAPGDNSVDFLAHLAYRIENIGGTSLFSTLGVGGKLRASHSPDQWLWDAELGGRLGRSFSLSSFIDSIDSGHGIGEGTQELFGLAGETTVS